MKNAKPKIRGKIRVDPTLDERYGDGPLFPHKIDRLNTLLKETKFDPAVSKPKASV